MIEFISKHIKMSGNGLLLTCQNLTLVRESITRLIKPAKTNFLSLQVQEGGKDERGWD